MKNTPEKNKKSALNKFSKVALAPAKSKNVKGGNDPITIEDTLDC